MQWSGFCLLLVKFTFTFSYLPSTMAFLQECSQQTLLVSFMLLGSHFLLFQVVLFFRGQAQGLGAAGL